MSPWACPKSKLRGQFWSNRVLRGLCVTWDDMSCWEAVFITGAPCLVLWSVMKYKQTQILCHIHCSLLELPQEPAPESYISFWQLWNEYLFGLQSQSWQRGLWQCSYIDEEIQFHVELLSLSGFWTVSELLSAISCLGQERRSSSIVHAWWPQINQCNSQATELYLFALLDRALVGANSNVFPEWVLSCFNLSQVPSLTALPGGTESEG